MYNIIIKSILRGDKMKTIEKKIIDVFFSGDKKEYNLSMRDRVIVRLDGSASYYLWNTEIVQMDSLGHIFLFPSSSTSEEDKYYHGYYWRNNYPPISNTTRSRLNAFIWEVLNTSGFYQKNWELYFGNNKIKVDTWYTIDRQNKTIVCTE